MFGLEIIDIIVILAYFATTIIIGYWSMRQIKNQEDYFLAGRRFGKFIQTFAAFGQSTSAENCVGVTTTTFTNGASGIWSSLLALPATPLYWMVIPWMRRLRLLTQGDFYTERYGSRPMAATYAILGSIMMMAYISVGFSAMGKTIFALTPKTVEQLNQEEVDEYRLAQELDELKKTDYVLLSESQKSRLKELQIIKPRKVFSHLNQNIVILVVCIVVLVYTTTGGLVAAFITDTIQGIFIIILTVLLIPFGWLKINSIYGGSGILDAFRTMHQQLPEAYFEIFGSPASIDFTWYYIIAVALMGLLNTTVQPNTLVATGSAKDEFTARFGFVTGAFMKRVCTVFWCLFALSAIVLYSESVHDSDFVWGHATLDLLGPLKIGLVGLMIACLAAALMSTADCLMLTSSSLLTHNLYQPLVPNRSENHYLWVGRFMGGLVVIGGAVIAMRAETILQLLKFIWEFNVIVAASFWLGMKWRRANKKAAWCSIISTMMLFFILPAILPVFFPSLKTNSSLLKMTKPEPMVRSYIAHEMDVKNRLKEIRNLEKLNAAGKSIGQKLQPLKVGQSFEKTFVLEPRSIFWTRGIKQLENGQFVGKGTLSIGLVVTDKLGFDLSQNPHALNQTIRVLIRTITPFVILVVIALFTKSDETKRLDRFFVKMKTPVLVDREKDSEELAKSYATPDRFKHVKLFPNSSWEFDKWDKVDTIGFVLSVAGVTAVIGLLVLLLNIGS
ncbi:MAG: sodium:solute symporter family protein [Planctomycetota bacterium]|jgi:SSS family solute:Na+ symporter